MTVIERGVQAAAPCNPHRRVTQPRCEISVRHPRAAEQCWQHVERAADAINRQRVDRTTNERIQLNTHEAERTG